jgi:cell division ATPase FtsA
VFGTPARVAFPRGLEGLVDGISSPAFSVIQGLILEGLNDDDYNMLRNKPLPVKGPSGSGVVGRVSGFLRNLLP